MRRTRALLVVLLLALSLLSAAPVAQANTGGGTETRQQQPQPPQAPPIDCTPLVDQPVEVDGLTAGIETCEETVSIATEAMPTGIVHVAAEQAGIYAGPGAQYSRLATIPKGTVLLLRGETRNGWVSIQLESAPLIGWAFAAYLHVDQWHGASEPNVSQILPTAPVTPAGATVHAENPLPAPGGRTTLLVQTRPPQRVSLTVLVCTGKDQATTRCLPQDGIDRVRIQILSPAGDALASGISDAQGRWTSQIPRSAGQIQVVAPLLGKTVSLDLASAQLDRRQQVVSIVVPQVAIPPTFR